MYHRVLLLKYLFIDVQLTENPQVLHEVFSSLVFYIYMHQHPDQNTEHFYYFEPSPGPHPSLHPSQGTILISHPLD